LNQELFVYGLKVCFPAGAARSGSNRWWAH